jgi:tellurite resistance protein TehA-like permease
VVVRATAPRGDSRRPAPTARRQRGPLGHGGAVAISSLACGRVVQAIDATGALGDLRDLLSAVAVALIVAELLWLPFLLAGELAAPRLQFSAARWATVFPVGMYAASTCTVGATAIMRSATASAAPARA